MDIISSISICSQFACLNIEMIQLLHQQMGSSSGGVLTLSACPGNLSTTCAGQAHACMPVKGNLQQQHVQDMRMPAYLPRKPQHSPNMVPLQDHQHA
jgi:hypothetical protein